MYNMCNTSYNTNRSSCRYGCGCSCGCNCAGQSVNANNSWWDSGYQSICRDCCGNIHVNNSRCGCCNGSQVTDANAECGGNFACVTVCGRATRSTYDSTCGLNGYGCNG